MSVKQQKAKPPAKNDIVTITIDGISHEGAGVGRVNGFTLFVHGALPGEEVQVKVVKVKKQFGFGKLLHIIKESADRVAPPCPVFQQCGGCQLQHASYESQLRMKQQQVKDSIERIGKLGHDVLVHPAIGMDEPWRYRNKAQVPVGVVSGKEVVKQDERQGGRTNGKTKANERKAVVGSIVGGEITELRTQLVTGFYAVGSHRIIDTNECLIQHEANDRVMRAVKQIGSELGISAYDEETHKGLLRHIVARTAYQTGEVMVVLVTNGKTLPNAKQWVDRIREAVPEVKSICQNINTKRTNVIFGDETIVLWGSDVIYDELGGIRFAISPRSFYQVNPVQTEVLYGKALEYAGLTGNETVVDAYCGIGTIALYMAKKAKKVYGVEIVPEAIEDAKRNAKLNGLDNAQFEVGAAEDVMPKWKEQGIEPDVIVVDPPRKGCDETLLETIVQMKPKRVVYVSCNPATLARDLAVLEAGGYRTKEVQPVDMFPHTAHVECVARLVRKE